MFTGFSRNYSNSKLIIKNAGLQWYQSGSKYILLNSFDSKLLSQGLRLQNLKPYIYSCVDELRTIIAQVWKNKNSLKLTSLLLLQTTIDQISIG